MRRSIHLAAFLSISTLSANGADWPQWRGLARTGHVPAGEVVPQSLPASPKVVWRVAVGDGVGSPVVSAGKVFHRDNQNAKETVHALDAATGKELWKAELDDVHKDSQSPAGPRSTPVVDGDRVYVQSCRGELRCLNVNDGSTVWQANYVKDFGSTFIGERGTAQGAVRHGYNGPPVVQGDHLIAGVGGKGASIVCFEKTTGKVVWKSQDDTIGYAAPVVATVAGVEQVLFFTADGMIGLDVKDGKLLWRVPVKTAFGRHVTTPVVIDDMVIVSSHQAGLIGVKVSKEGEGLKAEQAYAKKDVAINFASPVLVGEHLYCVGPRANLLCIDPKTGASTWSQTGHFRTSGDKTHAGFVAMNDKVLTLTDGGELVLFHADPKEFREISRVQVSGNTWCNPAYSDGKIYLRDAKELRCVQISP